MTWLEIALVVSNVVTLALALYRIDQLNMRRLTCAALQEAVSRLHRREGAVRIWIHPALRYYANPQAWQSPSRGKHSDAFRDRGERAREALEAARKILEDGK